MKRRSCVFDLFNLSSLPLLYQIRIYNSIGQNYNKTIFSFNNNLCSILSIYVSIIRSNSRRLTVEIYGNLDLRIPRAIYITRRANYRQATVYLCRPRHRDIDLGEGSMAWVCAVGQLPPTYVFNKTLESFLPCMIFVFSSRKPRWYFALVTRKAGEKCADGYIAENNR